MLVRVLRKGNLLHCKWKCKFMHSLWKTAWRLLKKLKMELPYDPANSLLDTYLEFEGNIHFDELNQVDPEKGIQRERETPNFLSSFILFAPSIETQDEVAGQGNPNCGGCRPDFHRKKSRQKSEGLLLLLLLTLTIPSTWLSIYIFLHAP